ncbi:MAG: hypothetical protein WC726_02300 [Parcubacteria group bacterium]|jgi:hypothetical protein
MSSQPKKRKNGYPKGLFRDIFFSATRELSPFGMVFVYEPENFEQQKLGTLFGIIKISDTSEESSFVANLLASVLKKEYFSKTDRSADIAFESALKKANMALAELARQGSVKWSGKISFAAGALEKNNLHFSKLGATAALLLRGGMIADIGEGMGIEAEGADPHPLKTFSDISSGKIEYEDCLIFATSDLLDIFSLEEIRQNAAFFSRDEFPEVISASLMANSELSGAIVVNMISEEEALQAITQQPAKIEYSPAPKIPESKDIFPKEKTAPKSIPTAVPVLSEAEKKKHLYMSETEEIPRKKFTEKIFPPMQKTARILGGSAVRFSKNITSSLRQVNLGEKISSVKSAATKSTGNLRSIDWKRMSPKILIGVGVVLIIVTAFFAFRSKNVPAPPVATPAQNVAPAVATLDDIQVKNVENISEVASLPSGSRELVFMGDSLFALNADKSILKINPASGETENTDSNVSGGKFSLATAMPDLGTIFILTDDKKMISFTPINKKFQENVIAFPENIKAADMKAYLTYIYLLDPTANQVYRYPRAEGGFGEKQDWLKAGNDIKDSVAFGINEDLFIATKNQTIPYFQGKKDDKINFENPNTPLVIEKIFAAPGLENIYVLDNKNHRIVQYSKDGKIAAQYWNKSIAGIKGFTVDEKNKVIYTQKANSLSKFSME